AFLRGKGADVLGGLELREERVLLGVLGVAGLLGGGRRRAAPGGFGLLALLLLAGGRAVARAGAADLADHLGGLVADDGGDDVAAHHRAAAAPGVDLVGDADDVAVAAQRLARLQARLHRRPRRLGRARLEEAGVGGLLGGLALRRRRQARRHLLQVGEPASGPSVDGETVLLVEGGVEGAE